MIPLTGAAQVHDAFLRLATHKGICDSTCDIRGAVVAQAFAGEWIAAIIARVKGKKTRLRSSEKTSNPSERDLLVSYRRPRRNEFVCSGFYGDRVRFWVEHGEISSGGIV